MDITHYYMEKGSGEALVLIHGNGENSSYFAHQMEDFSPRFRVIAPDTRGHGRTPRGTAPFTIRQFAEDLAGFLDRLGLERAHILGFSDGANIAMCFAFCYPHRVKKLILDGGNLHDGGVKRAAQRGIEREYERALASAHESEKARADAEMLGLMVGQPNITDEELGRITAPTLVMAGTRDLIKRSHTEYIAAHIPGAQLAWVEGDHFVAANNPSEFDRIVGEFLLK